jgi:hypothetical protein
MRLLLTSIVLGLAWFAAANIAASVLSWVASRLLPGEGRALAANVLLFLRLLPATAAILLVAVVFVPAHVLYEPAASDESFGAVLFAFAALGVALLVRAGVRLFQVSCTARQLRQWIIVPFESNAGEAFEAQGFPGVSLAGVLRTRILVGSDVRAVLTPDELDVAVAHEREHRLSFDNLKRCAMFCAPDLFGWTASAKMLEGMWRARAESQADVRAAAGDKARAMHLASALLKVARVAGRPPGTLQQAVWSPFHEPSLLETRVRRLVDDPSARPPAATLSRLALAAAAGAAATLWVSDAFYGIHRATEALISLLP